MFHIGFLNCPTGSHCGLPTLLSCVDGKMCVIAIEGKIIPQQYKDKLEKCLNDFSLSDPVALFLGGDFGSRLVFLSDLPIISNYDQTTDELCLWHTEYETYLVKNGKIINQSEQCPDKDIVFNSLVLNYAYAIAKKIELNLNSSLKISIDGGEKWDGRSKVITAFKKYLNSIDLRKMLSSLYVKVWDQYYSLRGSDSYYVYRLAKFTDGTEIEDSYLKQLIGIGQICLFEDHCDSSSFYKPNIPLGVYNQEELENEKQRIISKYSKEEHMTWLFYNLLYEQKHKQEKWDYWEYYRQSSLHLLDENFNFSKIKEMVSSDLKCIDIEKRPLSKLNDYIFRIQCNLPELRIFFCGDADNQNGIVMRKIDKIVSSFLTKNNVAIVTRDSHYMSSAEHTASSYRSSNYMKSYVVYVSSTRDNKLQVKQICDKVDVIYFFGKCACFSKMDGYYKVLMEYANSLGIKFYCIF